MTSTRETSGTEVRLFLVEIHSPDDSGDDSGSYQDCPVTVTARFEGDYAAAAEKIDQNESLSACNIGPATRRPGKDHIQFLTFAPASDIYRFFGVEAPLTPEQERRKRLFVSTYATTVGEMRKATAHLPDDFPLIHTGRNGAGESVNRLGIHVVTGEWEWQTASHQIYDGTLGGWSLRLEPMDPVGWQRLAAGTWQDTIPPTVPPYVSSGAPQLLQCAQDRPETE